MLASFVVKPARHAALVEWHLIVICGRCKITLGVLPALNCPEPPLCSGGSLGGGGGMCSSADGRGIDAWVLHCRGKQGLCTSGHRNMSTAPTQARQNPGRVLGKAHVKTYPLGGLKRGVMVGWGLGNPSGSLARKDCCSASITSGGPACRSSCAPSMWTENHTRSQGGAEAS